MLSNKLVVAALGFACITAAAAGGYLASRQNTSDALAAASAGAAAPAAPSAAPATPKRPVQETEAVVGDTVKPAGAVSPAAMPGAPAVSNAKVTSKRPEVEPPSRTPAPSVPILAKPNPAARPTPPPPLASTWPSSAGSQPPAAPAPASTPSPAADASAARPDDRAAQEPVRAPEPPQKTFEELVISADSVIGLQTENRISSETARIEDRVDARVTRDVKVDDRVAIPAGSKVIGSVTQVDRGGKFKERARLGIRFNQIVLADGTRIPVSTETIYRDGDAPGNSSAAKVGGAAVGGAILGAILGGAKGAAIGSTAGAGAGTAAVIASDRNAAVVPPGTSMTVRVLSPVTVTIER